MLRRCILCEENITTNINTSIKCSDCYIYGLHKNCSEINFDSNNISFLYISFRLYIDKNRNCINPSDWQCPYCQPRGILGTCWIPIGNIHMNEEDSVLAVLPKSHHLPNFMKVNSNNLQLPASYHIYKDEFVWHTNNFHAEDIIFMDSRLIHASTKNHRTDGKHLMSLDCRWFLSPVGRFNFNISQQGKFTEDINICRDI